MMGFLSALLSTLFITQSLFGAPTLQGVQNGTFSRFTGPFIGDVVDVNNTFFGGTSGSCTGPQDSTCNSCLNASPGEPCNTRRIHDGLRLTLTFIADTQGTVAVTNNRGTDFEPQPLEFTANVGGPESGILVEPGTEVTVNIPWGEICTKVFNSDDGTCNGVTNPGRQAIRVGISQSQDFLSDGEFIQNLFVAVFKMEEGSVPLCDEDDTEAKGICNFIAFPGDNKIFLESPRSACNLPSLGDSNVARFARVFYQEVEPGNVSFPDITTPTFADLRLNTTTGACNVTRVAELRDSQVGGLTNGKFYSFAIGLVDRANNVGFVTDMTGAHTVDGSLANTIFDGELFRDTTGCFAPGDESWTRNCHISRPDEVIGLIRDEFDCFITTAAYGSRFAEKVKTFRDFRNHYLKGHALGEAIISTYYKWSPPIAQWLQERPQMKAVVRAGLWPLWALAFLSLRAPWLFLSIISLVLLASVTLGRMRRAK